MNNDNNVNGGQEFIKKKNKKRKDFSNNYNQESQTLPFYLMTLEVNNEENKQIKIYQNSDAFELAFNFCKENNLDSESMKYILKKIEEIIKKFNEKEKNKLYYINKNSIFELVDEENNEKDSESKIEIYSEKRKNKTTKKIMNNLVKRRIKFNQLNVNRVSPLQRKINEQFKKISNIKKHGFINSNEININRIKNKQKSKLSINNLYEKNNFSMYKFLSSNSLNIKRNNFMKNKKNWNNGNKRIITFSPSLDSFENGVPELKSSESLNVIKDEETKLLTETGNKIMKSFTRKFEDEGNDEDYENEKSLNKKILKKNFKTENIKKIDKINKYFNLNKKERNANSNNYNYIYRINNNNNININNNNNIFNTLNSLTYNNDQYQLHYINPNTLIENNLNYKTMNSKKSNIDNLIRIGSKSLNDKEKDDKNKTNYRKKISPILFAPEYKNSFNLVKSFTKKLKVKEPYSISNNSKNSYILVKEYQDTINMNKKIQKNKSNHNELFKTINLENEIDDIKQALSYSSRNKFSPSNNDRKGSKSLSKSNNSKNNKIKKKILNKEIILNKKLHLNLKMYENLKKNNKDSYLKKLIKERIDFPHLHNSRYAQKDKNSPTTYLKIYQKSKKIKKNNSNSKLQNKNITVIDKQHPKKINIMPKYSNNIYSYNNKYTIKIRTISPNNNNKNNKNTNNTKNDFTYISI